MMAKKILLINDHGHFGGGGDAVLNTEKRFLIEAGYEVYFLSFNSESIYKGRIISFQESKSRILNKCRKFLSSVNIKKFLKNTITEIKPDLIHCHLISKYPIDVFKAVEGHKVIVTLHGPNLFCSTAWGGLTNGASCEQGIGVKCYLRGCTSLVNTSLYSYMKSKYWPHLLKNTSLFHCPSRQIYSTAKRLGINRLTYLPLGIDKQFELPVMKTISDRKILLFVGAVSEVKGIKVLLHAFKIIVRKYPDVLLKIAGRGKLDFWVKNFIAEHGLHDNVAVLGFVNHDDIRDLYIQADVFLMPSIWQEQFGLVGAEALACKTPCVATNVGGIPEWLQHNQSGFIVPPLAIDELAEATIKLLSNEDLRTQFGEYGRKYILKEYSSLKYKKNVINMIERVL